MNQMYKRVGLVVATMFILITGCKFNSAYERSLDIENGAWNKNQALKYDVTMKDTINGYDIYFDIRNNNDYRYKNLFLFVTTSSPAGLSKRDTVEIILADDKGKWLGLGIGGVNKIEKTYKRNIRFPNAGNYRIQVLQGMRNDVLDGIMDVGVRVEKVK